jgi:hypothetical protein
VPGSWTRGSWLWSYEGSEPHVSYEANLVDPDAAWPKLSYTASGNPMDYRVRLVTTKPTFGGRRWWFLCPLARKDGGPPRRVAKLYLPRRAVFREPRGLRAHLPVMPGEREIRRALSTASCGHGHGSVIFQARDEAVIGDFPRGACRRAGQSFGLSGLGLQFERGLSTWGRPRALGSRRALQRSCYSRTTRISVDANKAAGPAM